MAFEGAPVPSDRTEVIRYKIAAGIWNLFTGGSSSAPASAIGVNGSGLPYGADQMIITNAAAGPSSIQFKRGGRLLATRALSYTNSGASSTDVLTQVLDTIAS